MATPAIATAGANNGLLLVTDNDGKNHRVPLLSIADIYDSSNANVCRLDIKHSLGEINLIFDTDVQLAAALTLIDTLY